MMKVNIFICYSHRDEDYLEDIKAYINENSLQNSNIWYDGKIPPGASWDDKIKEHLNKSHIVLLLISQWFLNSEYINNTELRNALENHSNGTCRVIPIFTRKCNLDKYPQITSLQGLPMGMKFLSEMGNERDTHYADIQKKIEETINELLKEKEEAFPAGEDEQNDALEDITQLKKNRTIYLSVQDSDEGRKRRQDFMYVVEGKIRHEKWLYTIVPGIDQLKGLTNSKYIPDIETVAGFISQSIYSIHIITSEKDIEEGFSKMQYDLTAKHAMNSLYHKKIIWFLDSEIKEKLRVKDTEATRELWMNPIVTGNDYECIFKLISELESEKEKLVNSLILERSVHEKKVIMFYDFSRDHNSDLRINLKTKVEEYNLSVRPIVLNETLEKEKEAVGKCEGALIFYGASDPQWFLVRQAILFDAKNIKSKAVCLDEPEVEKKLKRDVAREFQIIYMKNFEEGVRNFVQKLN
jgi:TIR domain